MVAIEQLLQAPGTLLKAPLGRVLGWRVLLILPLCIGVPVYSEICIDVIVVLAFRTESESVELHSATRVARHAVGHLKPASAGAR